MSNSPGFNPDPHHAGQERYWNGSEWTDQPDLPQRQPIGPVVKSVLLLLIALVAVIVTVAVRPVSYTPDNYVTEIAEALASDKINNNSTTGAPQQTVVNGWTAKDLLTITAHELDVVAHNSSVRDDRPAILLLLAILAIAVLGFDFDGVLRRRR